MAEILDSQLNKILDLRSQNLVIVDNLWSSELLESLHLELIQKKEEMKAATIGSTRISNQTIRKDKIIWWDLNHPTDVQEKVNKEIENIKTLLNRNLFLGIKDHELHYALYSPGDFYLRHIDQILQKKDRVVTFILYLNKNWSQEDGGRLLVYEDFNSKNPIYSINPIWGRTVLFLSDTSPHEVETTNKNRNSLTGWFRK